MAGNVCASAAQGSQARASLPRPPPPGRASQLPSHTSACPAARNAAADPCTPSSAPASTLKHATDTRGAHPRGQLWQVGVPDSRHHQRVVLPRVVLSHAAGVARPAPVRVPGKGDGGAAVRGHRGALGSAGHEQHALECAHAKVIVVLHGAVPGNAAAEQGTRGMTQHSGTGPQRGAQRRTHHSICSGCSAPPTPLPPTNSSQAAQPPAAPGPLRRRPVPFGAALCRYPWVPSTHPPPGAM